MSRPNQGDGRNQQKNPTNQRISGMPDCVGCGRRDYETPMVRTRRGPHICAHCVADAWAVIAPLKPGSVPVNGRVFTLDPVPRLDFLR